MIDIDLNLLCARLLRKEIVVSTTSKTCHIIATTIYISISDFVLVGGKAVLASLEHSVRIKSIFAQLRLNSLL